MHSSAQTLSYRTSRPALLVAIVAAHAAIALAFIGIFKPRFRPPPAPSDLSATISPVTPRTIDEPPELPAAQLADRLPALVLSPPTSASFIGLPPDPNRYYPPDSIVDGEQGAVIVRLCVNTDGSFDGPPSVERSSGYPRLDAAAVRWGRDVRQMRPATVHGTPIYSCKAERVVFKAH